MMTSSYGNKRDILKVTKHVYVINIYFSYRDKYTTLIGRVFLLYHSICKYDVKTTQTDIRKILQIEYHFGSFHVAWNREK